MFRVNIKIINNYRWLLLYGFFGVGTLATNIFSYALCSKMLHMSTALSNFIAWLTALVFAYVSNRKWVFESNKTGFSEIFKECVSFTSCRVMTGILDIFLMVILVDGFHLYDMKVKMVTNVIVIIINLLACKKVIFKDELDMEEIELADKYIN